MGALALPMALAGCATPPPKTSCAPITAPSPKVLGQSEARGYSDGYRAGELAQALRDQARARQAAAATAPSQPPITTAATPLTVAAAAPTKNATPPLPPSAPTIPAATSHDNFAISGPPIPLGAASPF